MNEVNETKSSAKGASFEPVVMCEITQKEWLDQATLIYKQTKETVQQEADGVTVRMATITCPCGWKRGIMHMYKCLYCKVWMCQNCSETHFGKTVEQYRNENPQST